MLNWDLVFFLSQSREQTVCYLCDDKNVEDEIHFLFFCNKYKDERLIMFHKIKKQHIDFESKEVDQKLQILSESPIILGNYIKKAFSQCQMSLYESSIPS